MPCVTDSDGYCYAHREPAECDANADALAAAHRDAYGCSKPTAHRYGLCDCHTVVARPTG